MPAQTLLRGFLLLVFLGSIVAQTQNCNQVNPTCNGGGVCTSEGGCRCFFGHFGDMNSELETRIVTHDACDRQFVKDIPGFRAPAIALLVFTATFYFFALLLSSYRLAIEFVFSSSSETSRITTKYVLILIVINSLVLFLNSLDFWGNFGILNFKANLVLDSISHPLFLITFCALFFHWVELYQNSTKSLKKAEMLKKIRSDYDANVSMEDILLNLSFLKKFKYVYGLLAYCSFGIWVAYVWVFLLIPRVLSYLVVIRLYDAYFVAVWIILTGAFLWYGIKLMRIMPESISKKIKEMTILIGIFAVSALTSNIIDLVNIQAEWHSLKGIWIDYVCNGCDVIGIYCAIFMYIPIWEWHKYFNVKMIKSLLSTSRTSNQSSVSVETVNSDKAESVSPDAAENHPSNNEV